MKRSDCGFLSKRCEKLKISQKETASTSGISMCNFYPKCLTLQNPSRVRNACADMRAFSLRLRSVCLCKRNLFQKESFLTAAEEETGGGTGLVVWRKCKNRREKNCVASSR